MNRKRPINTNVNFSNTKFLFLSSKATRFIVAANEQLCTFGTTDYFP